MKVAVVAHAGKVLGGGLSELRAVLGEYGVREPMWAEVDKSRKAPKRVSAALKDGAGLVIVWGGDGMVQQCVSELAGSGVPMPSSQPALPTSSPPTFPSRPTSPKPSRSPCTASTSRSTSAR